MKKSCLRCHGNPLNAPKAVVERYGSKGGFHRRVGEVIALDTVAIPRPFLINFAPIIALCPLMELDTGRCKEAGFEAVLNKPIRRAELYQTIERVIWTAEAGEPSRHSRQRPMNRINTQELTLDEK
ncbi:MAG: DUF3365 domain-containing protein [Deltaproteobacteria bacterium]|nr:DUF3365 domain-containing protein [Deltaproteobacteria bacterium]MBW1919737.1 DUF3365 domain-containing protein [Deltaproteobacteria bacterium]MBW1935882.1 DUF3365 domain-containing protein [Deltaproteobacteria bacterium]MBW1978529.1 DUF3365 domain-containing protein [Deltaproteobacteria bacterium]MBW2045323.1 DUF3365 domain-containing protein [Deltaproteobacteria bacterium]